MNRLLPCIVCALMAWCCMTGCSERHSGYSSFAETDPHGWAYGDTLTFTASMLDSTHTRQIDAAIRHSGDYMYRNLWLEVSYRSADGIMRRDTVEMVLADMFGRWIGSGFGPSYQMQVPVAKDVPLADSTQIHVRHIMRVDTLQGIQQVGIFVNKAQNS
ncbi:MAG: gliding motility lipoprotein GldH [Muribaculaceae bacterium]|nr:gliding motility lipoprotein GldH [Muribaculaceae bacterium]